jgi:histidine triad (HIT) family protein|tara:strand:+ start:48 stop:440 length:393 start_codon:yes stop_codon:yes gene_type:complete
MSSIFSKIIDGIIPCYKIAENESFLAFLDIQPLVQGHTLVIPKKEIDYIFDLDDSTLKEMMIFSKMVSEKLKAALPCKRIGVSIIGLEVPHAHIHLVPINDIDDMNFSKPKLNLSKNEMSAIQEQIIKQV